MGELEEQSTWGFETRAVHAGQEPDPVTGAVVTPISLSTTFAQDGVGGHKGFEYSRSGNPTRAALESCVASLESGRHGLAFASGLAAEDNVLRLLNPGDRVLLGNDAYGGTFRLIAKVHTGLHVDRGRPHRHRSSWSPNGRTTPSSCGWRRRPTPCCAASTSRRSARSPTIAARWCASTTRSPRRILQQPLTLGADVVVHSATKYLGGHSDVVGGFLALDDDELAARLHVHAERRRRGAGAVRLLPRAARREDAGRADGAALRQRPRRSSTCWSAIRRSSGCSTRSCPTIPGTPPRRKQMRDFGGMVSFTLRGGSEAALRGRCRDRSCSCSPSRWARSRA